MICNRVILGKFRIHVKKSRKKETIETTLRVKDACIEPKPKFFFFFFNETSKYEKILILLILN